MTKQGGFKRAARQRARAFGQRYTEARAALEQGRSAERPTRPYEHAALRAHLEAHYEMRITQMAPIDDPDSRPRGSWEGHYPSTLLVRREGGPPWVVRVFSSPVDEVSRVEGDAQILRFLAAHAFPAERPAHDRPVSVLDGAGVIVTDFIEGGRPSDANGRTQSPAVFFELASLLGRLHTLPAGDGAVARDGGSEEHDGSYVGRPKADLAAAMNYLASVEHDVAPEGREKFEWLRDQVEQADDAEGLPEALTHGNYHAWAAVGKPGGLHIVGWAGSGRGPRLPALAWLLRTSAEVADPACVEAVMRGYREHVQLTDEELERLPSVLNMRPLWLACFEYRRIVRSGRTPKLTEGWTRFRPDDGEGLAAQAIAALRS